MTTGGNMIVRETPGVSGDGRTREQVRQARSTARENGQTLFSEEAWGRVGTSLGLSSREREVLRQIFNGNKQVTIAQNMGLSLGTIKTYSQRIHQKLRVSNRVELTLAVVGAYHTLYGAQPTTPASTISRT